MNNESLRWSMVDFLMDISIPFNLGDSNTWSYLSYIFEQCENDDILPYPKIYYLGHWIYLECNPDGWLAYAYKHGDWGYNHVAETGAPSVEEAIIKAQNYISTMLVHEQLSLLIDQWYDKGKITKKEWINLIHSYLY